MSRSSRLLSVWAALACVWLAGRPAHAPAADQDAPPYKVVKLSQLIETIKRHKGKVVVMDLWNDG